MTSEMQRSYCKRGQIALCISPMARQNGPAKYMDSMRQQQPWCNSVCVCVCVCVTRGSNGLMRQQASSCKCVHAGVSSLKATSRFLERRNGIIRS